MYQGYAIYSRYRIENNIEGLDLIKQIDKSKSLETFWIYVLANQPQNSQQKSVPDPNILTVAFLALKNGFLKKKKFSPPKFFFYLFLLQLFSADAMVFLKKFKKNF